MSIKILIPTPLRPYTGNKDTIEIDAPNVGEALRKMAGQYSEVARHLFNDDGRLRSYVNVYVNDEDIRYLQREATPLSPGDTISIVPSVAGGKVEDAPPEVLPSLSKAEISRYGRHLTLPEVGLEGQRRLKAGRVLCVGAGGLGSPAALYLAAAGVGTVGIVDFDVVDFSNLQRQIIHGTPDVGRPKLDSAADRLKALNPEVTVVRHDAALSSKNALEILHGYDVIVDGTDNFPTRYLVNDACVLLGIPNAYGSIFRFEGQASVFATKGGPCYRCLYPEPPPPGLVPSCAEGGVLGVLPGVIGTIQATEAIKLIVGIGEPLIGRFLIYDALRMRFRELKLRRDVDCPVCGDHPTVKALIDYEQFCGVGPEPVSSGNDQEEWTVEQLKSALDGSNPPFLVDVREPTEYAISRIEQARLIPLGELMNRTAEVPRDRQVIVHCKSGIRSAKAVRMLREKGFTNAKNLAGGILAWSDRIDPSQPKY